MNGFLFPDLLTMSAAALAVIFVGLSKGGLGGGMSLLGFGILSLFIPPLQVAGLLLPILLVMDAVSVWSWRREWDQATLFLMLPGAVLGLCIGWATAAFVPEEFVRVIVGAIAFLFAVRYFTGNSGSATGRSDVHRPLSATFWSTISGYTSFVIHAGQPPYQIYTVPLRQDPKVFTGTSARFFATLNFLKVIPYIALGTIDTTNFKTSLLLMPIAAIATVAGVSIVRRLRPGIFYPLMYGMIMVVSCKLIWDGARALV